MTKNEFETRLQALREKYLENAPISMTDQSPDEHVFAPLSIEERDAKIITALTLLEEKKREILSEIERLENTRAGKEQIVELHHQLDATQHKIELFQQKHEMLHSGDSDDAKKEKLKHQLVELEVKRTKLVLAGKDVSKLQKKIDQKKELFRKILQHHKH